MAKPNSCKLGGYAIRYACKLCKQSCDPTRYRCEDEFCLFSDARAKRASGLNGSGCSPRKFDIDCVRPWGITAPCVPWGDVRVEYTKFQDAEPAFWDHHEGHHAILLGYHFVLLMTLVSGQVCATVSLCGLRRVISNVYVSSPVSCHRPAFLEYDCSHHASLPLQPMASTLVCFRHFPVRGLRIMYYSFREPTYPRREDFSLAGTAGTVPV